MFGAEPTSTWWRRPVMLAGAAGLVAGVVIGGAGHSLPASSTRPISHPATRAARATVTVTATPTVTHTQTILVTVTDHVTPSAAPVAGRPSAGSASSGSKPGVRSAAPASTKPVKISPIARCKDGTLSYAAHHQGACSHHGGVATWYR
jgi:hypothetical protein